MYLKVERYLQEHFDADPRSQIYVVVVLEEETESANALKMMAALQTYQSALREKPKYERELYRNLGTKHQMDDLNFDKENIIVMEGNAIIDVPLAQILAEYYMTDSSLTSIVREIDVKEKPKVVVKIEMHEIFGYADLSQETNLPTEKVFQHVKRLVIKTDNDTANDLSVKVRRNLLKK